MEGKKLHLAVVGGGICGLTFAIALSRLAPDINVDIYEAAPHFSEVGAGMAMWPRVTEMLNVLGVGEALRNKQTRTEQGIGYTQYRRSDLPEGVPFGQSTGQFQTYHRAEFLQALLDNAPPNYRTHFSKRLTSYTDPQQGDSPCLEPLTLQFADGSTASCDVLVGADGIKSTVRDIMYKALAAQARADNAPDVEVERLDRLRLASWTGQKIWRALVPRDKLEEAYPDHPSSDHAVVYMGRNREVITYPISQGRVINTAWVLSEPDKSGTIYDGPWQAPGDLAEFSETFHDFEPPIQALLKLISQTNIWAVNTVDGLTTFVSGRVGVLGDAAHAMTPYQASGAGQGVEDGMIMAALFASPFTTRATVAAALRVYDAVRRPFAQRILRLSFETGQLGMLQRPEWAEEYQAVDSGQITTAEWLADPEKKRQMLENLEGLARDKNAWTDWAMELGDVQEEREKALVMLKETVQI